MKAVQTLRDFQPLRLCVERHLEQLGGV